jgi:hypothetical protein
VTAAKVETQGLTPLVKTLKGSLYKDVNKELRMFAKLIAQDMVPDVQNAVRESGAPQASDVALSVRAISDRVPVVVIGKTNPFPAKKWRRKGTTARSSKARRGSMAHGVVYGPKGGRPDTTPDENYYRILRSDSGGRVGAALRGGKFMDDAADANLKVYASVMRHHGFIGHRVKALNWNGKG